MIVKPKWLSMFRPKLNQSKIQTLGLVLPDHDNSWDWYQLQTQAIERLSKAWKNTIGTIRLNICKIQKMS